MALCHIRKFKWHYCTAIAVPLKWYMHVMMKLINKEITTKTQKEIFVLSTLNKRAHALQTILCLSFLVSIQIRSCFA